MITGILLAAGASTRFGSNKLLYELDDAALVMTAASNLLVAVDRVLAVVRPDDDAVRELLASSNVPHCVCPQAGLGVGHSIACGIRASVKSDGWLIALADMPWIKPSTIKLVANTLGCGAEIVAPSFDGKRGHPVGFTRQFVDELLSLSGDQGAQSILKKHHDKLALLSCDDPGVLQDIDVPDDLPLIRKI